MGSEGVTEADAAGAAHERNKGCRYEDPEKRRRKWLKERVGWRETQV